MQNLGVAQWDLLLLGRNSSRETREKHKGDAGNGFVQEEQTKLHSLGSDQLLTSVEKEKAR